MLLYNCSPSNQKTTTKNHPQSPKYQSINLEQPNFPTLNKWSNMAMANLLSNFFLMEQPTIFIGAIVLQIEKLVHYRAFTIVEEYFSTNRYYRWKHMLVRTVGWKQFDLRYEIHDIKYWCICIQYFVHKKNIIQSTKYWKNTRCSDYQFDLSYKTQDGGLDGVAFHGYWYTPFLFCLLFGLNTEPNLTEHNTTYHRYQHIFFFSRPYFRITFTSQINFFFFSTSHCTL